MTTSPHTPSLGHPLAQDLLLDPSRWQIWPAVAVLRWLYRNAGDGARQIFYRSRVSLAFSGSEIADVAVREGGMDLTLNAPGLAALGSSLPTSDIDRIIRDQRQGGGIAAWLDGPGDRFMQAVEAAETRNNAGFALSKGGGIEALRILGDLIGRTAVLEARPGGALLGSGAREPEGTAGLSRLFIGPISASGLASLFEAVTNLPVTVREFSGAEVPVRSPARVGMPFGRILGSRCHLATAGVEVFIDGGTKPEAQEWARDPIRRRSLHYLYAAYVGSDSPSVQIFLRLASGNASPSALDGAATLGGAAVLGEADRAVRIPLKIEGT